MTISGKMNNLLSSISTETGKEISCPSRPKATPGKLDPNISLGEVGRINYSLKILNPRSEVSCFSTYSFSLFIWKVSTFYTQFNASLQ